MAKSDFTVRRLFAIWWAFAWRSLLIGVLGGGAIGFVIGLVMGLMRLNAYISPVSLAAGLIWAVPAGLLSLKGALTAPYKGFRITLSSPQDAAAFD